MNTKNAVKILEKQLGKLNNKSDKNWILQTKSYIKDFLGEDSEEYKKFIAFNFPLPYANLSESLNKRIREESEEEIKSILLITIDTLKTKGIKTEHFLNNISETAFWTIISILLPGLLGIGFFFGNLQSDKQNIDLRIELRKVQDSLLVYRSIIPMKTPVQREK